MPVQMDLQKKRLEEQRDRLQHEIEQLGIPGETNLGLGNHMADDASLAYEQEQNFRLRRILTQELSQVEAALQRIEEGRYGICEVCGNPIDPARLKAMPSANLCLADLQRQEVTR
ncbi:MAG: TraR/DksA family transcriptional regulator [Anaerolineae bacterium]